MLRHLSEIPMAVPSTGWLGGQRLRWTAQQPLGGKQAVNVVSLSHVFGISDPWCSYKTLVIMSA